MCAPLSIGHIELEDGELVQGFVCETWAVGGAETSRGLGAGALFSPAKPDDSPT